MRAPQDFAAGASLLAIALFALWASRDLPMGSLRAMGPGMLPRGVAALLGAVGAALVALSCLRRGAALERWRLRGPFFVSLGILGFALTVRSAGLVLAGPFVAIVSGAASPDARIKELLLFGVAITAFSVALFRFALHLPIPILVIPGVVVI